MACITCNGDVVEGGRGCGCGCGCGLFVGVVVAVACVTCNGDVQHSGLQKRCNMCTEDCAVVVGGDCGLYVL